MSRAVNLRFDGWRVKGRDGLGRKRKPRLDGCRNLLLAVGESAVVICSVYFVHSYSALLYV
jgi:hypothetical protein